MNNSVLANGHSNKDESAMSAQKKGNGQGDQVEDFVEESSDAPVQEKDDEESSLGIRFFPPLYIQRYEKVLELLSDQKWVHAINRVIDFGCAECKLLLRLKRLPFLRELIGVDIDKSVLKDSIRATEPIIFEYIEPREFTPLDMYLMCGSIADKDIRLVDPDVVTAIELIEHLDPEILEQFPETVFGFLRPKLVIVTTPNQEFNVRFDSFEGPFRHWDHRFEWTRAEFENWSKQIVNKYTEYKVSFFGIGEEPVDGRNTGHCSQGAIFVRRDFEASANNGDFLSELDLSTRTLVETFANDVTASQMCPYVVIRRHEYPFRRDDRPLEEKILSEAEYLMRSMARASDEWLETMPTKFPLEFLIGFSGLKKFETSVKQLSDVLKDNGYEVGVDDDSAEFVLVPFEPEEESSEEEQKDDEADLNTSASTDRHERDEDDESWD